MNPKLVELFQKLPGIGPKQATRFVYYLMRSNTPYKDALIKEIQNIKLEASECPVCYRYHNYVHYDKEHPHFCSICIDENRDDCIIMIVEKELDVDAIERTGSYSGKYFVLGGLLPFLADKPTEIIKIRELTNLVHRKLQGFSPISVESDLDQTSTPSRGGDQNEHRLEIVYALPVTDEGDHTIEYLNQTLSQIVGIDKAKISILARGLSSGLDIEYVDRDTFFEAYKRRI